jgi:hypothetical protein
MGSAHNDWKLGPAVEEEGLRREVTRNRSRRAR